MERKERVQGFVKYDLVLNIKDGEEYSGIVTVHLNLKETKNGIFLDY